MGKRRGKGIGRTFEDSRRRDQIAKNIRLGNKPSPEEIRTRQNMLDHLIEKKFGEEYKELENNPKTSKAFAELEEETIKAKKELQGLSGPERYKRMQELLDSGFSLSRKQAKLNTIIRKLNSNLDSKEKIAGVRKEEIEHWLSG